MSKQSGTESEEPVAYLGGAAGGPPQPAPDEVAGFLGGAAQEEELPALPAANVSAVYSASDFVSTAPVDEAEEEPPPAYDTYADEPAVAPQTDQQDYDQYGEPPPEDEPPPGTATVVEPQGEPPSDFEEPGLPKTISQQDAENIIKRITTKKILPPDVSAHDGRTGAGTELTRRGGPQLGRTVVILVVLFLLAGGAIAFKEELKPYLPEALRNAIFGAPPPKPFDPTPPPVSKELRLERALRKKVLESEWRAFGYKNEAEFLEAQSQNKPAKTPKPSGTESPSPNGSKPK